MPGLPKGQILGQMPAGYNWGDYVQAVCEHQGISVAGLAQQLADELDVEPETVRKGLVRLQHEVGGGGGKWGRALVERHPSLPALEDLGGMVGQYHGPMADIPSDLRERVIASLDGPPFSLLPAGGWLFVARASQAIREESWDRARSLLAMFDHRAGSAALRLETTSLLAFVASRTQRREAQRWLDRMHADLDSCRELHHDQACYRARWVDQQAYEFRKPVEGSPDFVRAAALFTSLPDGGDAPAFVRIRRALGLSTIEVERRGDVALAWSLAEQAADLAGDHGLLQIRAQCLAQQARCAERLGRADKAVTLRQRALEIATYVGSRSLENRLRKGARP